MKKILLLTLIGFCLCLISCYEINEIVEINENGSGTYATKMDMSALIELMQSIGSEEDFKKEGLDKQMDTVINFKSFTDTASDLTADQKKLLETGKIHMVMNMEEKKFIMDMDFKFDDLKELEMLMSGAGTSNMGKSFSSAFKGNDTTQRQVGGPSDLELGNVSQVYDVKVEKNRISKTLNKARYDSLMANPQMAQMQQMTGSGMEILYTQTIKFPRPVKTSDNAIIKLSADKRTATIKYNLLDAFSNPDKYGFVIEY